MSTAITTSTPAIRPMTAAEPTLTKAQGAVIATSPASAPFMIMERSGFFCRTHDTTVALE